MGVDRQVFDLLGLVELLEARDDVNATLLQSVRTLALDGCPSSLPAELPECGSTFADLDATDAILKRELAAFFELELSDRGPGATRESSAALRVELRQ